MNAYFTAANEKLVGAINKKLHSKQSPLKATPLLSTPAFRRNFLMHKLFEREMSRADDFDQVLIWQYLCIFLRFRQFLRFRPLAEIPS